MWGLSFEENDQLYMKGLLCVLRIPGLFLLDMWWTDHLKSSIPVSLDLQDLADSGLNLILVVMAMFILLLPLKELVRLYMNIFSGTALSLSVFSIYHFVEDEIKIRNETPSGESIFGLDFLKRHLTNGASFITLTQLISWCLDSEHPVFRRVCPKLYLAPVIISMLGAPAHVTAGLTLVIHCFMAMFVCLYLVRCLFSSAKYLQETFLLYHQLREELGTALLVIIVRRMFEPVVLGGYWIVQFLAQVWSDQLQLEKKMYLIQDSDWLVQVLVSVSETVDSPLMLISYCIIIMALSYSLLTLSQLLLSQCGAAAGAGQPAMPTGLTEGVVTFVLGMQTGLIDLDMPGRVGAVSIILFVVVASLLQSLLEITHPVLLSLPATTSSLCRHFAPVALTLASCVIPLIMVHYLLTRISSDLWTLVIVSSCLVTAVQSLGHLSTYIIIFWDCCQTLPSPNTDDYIYYVQALTKTGELLLAVAVVFGGFYESFVVNSQQDWTVVNSVVLVTHCYFNIYSRVSQGWASYLARRDTSRRLNTLATATESQLRDHGDLCSICYQDMEEPHAVITNCQHFFHKSCLKKWLVVQDNCPLCTKPVVAEEQSLYPLDDDDDSDDDKNISAEDDNLNEDVEDTHEDTGEDILEINLVGEEGSSELRFRGTNNNNNRENISCLFDGD